VTAVTVGRENMGLLLLLLCCCVLSQAFSPRQFFSGITVDLQRSGFKFQTTELSLLCQISPSICIFFSESIECFPGMAFKTFFRPFVAIPVVPIMNPVF
jgi:hypothetical protein